jgi:hypothetical protein
MHATEAAAVTVAVLTAANFLWEIFTKRNWSHAIELSYFQGVAIVAYLAFTTM